MWIQCVCVFRKSINDTSNKKRERERFWLTPVWIKCVSQINQWIRWVTIDLIDAIQPSNQQSIFLASLVRGSCLPRKATTTSVGFFAPIEDAGDSLCEAENTMTFQFRRICVKRPGATAAGLLLSTQWHCSTHCKPSYASSFFFYWKKMLLVRVEADSSSLAHHIHLGKQTKNTSFQVCILCLIETVFVVFFQFSLSNRLLLKLEANYWNDTCVCVCVHFLPQEDCLAVLDDKSCVPIEEVYTCIDIQSSEGGGSKPVWVSVLRVETLYWRHCVCQPIWWYIGLAHFTTGCQLWCHTRFAFRT